MKIIERLRLVKEKAREINLARREERDKILKVLREEILKRKQEILKANEKDIKKAKDENLKKSLIDRIILKESSILNMAEEIESIIMMKDPVDELVEGFTADDGLKIEKVKVPLGVVGVVYNARPNVLIEAFSLCVKSGNAIILAAGEETKNTCDILLKIIKNSLKHAGMSESIIEFITIHDDEDVMNIIQTKGFIDLLIPRGDEKFISFICDNARIPVIQTAYGNCHIYVDEFADLQMALDIVFNAKISNPSVCNAVESLVVHKNIASSFLNQLQKEFKKFGVQIFGCEKTFNILKDIHHATEEDYYCEYLDLKISIKIVDNFEEAVEHILKHSSKHSESIITNNYFVAERFLKLIDSAVVYVNASTRFTDGALFKKGAEIGISSQKLHARGPMGLNELMTTKYLVRGTGQTRK